MHVHVPLWGEAVSKKTLDDIFLVELLNGVPGKFSVEKVQGLREVLVDGCVIAPVIELAEPRQEVFRFFVLGFVDEIFVGYGLGPADFVNADHHRLEAFERPHNLYIH